LEKTMEENNEIPFIMISGHGDLDTAVECIKKGAFDYISKPPDLNRLLTTIRNALNNKILKTENKILRKKIDSKYEMIGESKEIKKVKSVIEKISETDARVLITGENGTGKELVAHAIHQNSKRKKIPMIEVNCAAIPSELIESELFGHEKGSFTGAVEQRIGRFEQANGGTLFLDEIGDMPLETQTRLLRVLSNKEFYRVGGDKPIKVDVRILAATHQDLENLVSSATFREDLFYRLNVIRIDVPPLRKRIEDIADLSSAFLKSHADDLVEPIKVLSKEALKKLSEYSWPGNVRQLENVCYWLALMAPSKDIQPSDLPQDILDGKVLNPSSDDWRDGFKAWIDGLHETTRENLLESIEPEIDKLLIEFALDKTSGKKQEAAKLLGLGRNTLAKKIKELNN